MNFGCKFFLEEIGNGLQAERSRRGISGSESKGEVSIDMEVKPGLKGDP